jgi:hypothetical protein
LLSFPAFAQIDRSALSGTIRDSQNSVVPGATITLTENNTGLKRTTFSNVDGVYWMSDLPAGDYAAVVLKRGFTQARYENIRQDVGQTRTLDVILLPSSPHNDEVTVSAPRVEMDRTDATLGSGIESEAIQQIPLNGRNWASLTALIPGAIDSGGSNQRSIRFVGRGRDDMNITYDGVDATGIANQAQKTAIRLSIPTEAISEFRVDTAQYSAEYGDASGAQLVLASPTGGNEFRGSIFEYLRNSLFDARSPLDSTHSPLPFRLNQFGGEISGPLWKDKTFFFASYEGYQQVQDQTLIGFVPSPSFRAQVLTKSPALTAILNAYPQGIASTSTPNVEQYTGVGRIASHENSEMVRIDHHFTDHTTAYLRFNFDNALSLTPLGTLLDQQKVPASISNGVAEMLHVFSPTLLDEFKFGVNQAISRTLNITTLPYTVNVSGFSALNSNQTSDQDGTTFSWLDNLNWSHGRHFLRAGVLVRRIQMNEGNSASGTLTYSSLNNFLNNALDSATQVSLLPLKRMRKTQESGYIQDEFKLRDNLTINAGLRYEYFSVFHESTGRAAPFDFGTCGGLCPPGSSFYIPTKGGFDPRFALAWSPTAMRSRMTIRSGYGIYHEDGQFDDQNFPIANDVASYNLTRGAAFPNLSYPIAQFLVNATGILTPKDLARQRKDAYAQDWSLSIQQDLGDSFLGTLSYLGTKGTNIMNRSYTNLINPLTGTRPYPQYGRIEFRQNQSNSTFHALQASVQRAFNHGWLLAANYMWSHSINDASLGSGVEDDFPENVSCRACERASSDQDARHSVSAYAVYQLPFGKGRRFFNDSGVLRAIFGGWGWDVLATGRSGLPVNITVDRASTALPDGNNNNQRPNYVAGVPLAPPAASSPNLWINAAAFAVPANGTWGNLGRNAFRGPSLWQIDTAMTRRLFVTERLNLQLRGECFNVLNRAQYGNPLADISAPASFGRITSLVNTSPTGGGTPRQFQVAVHLQF